jgi:hypothetical protein
MGDLARKMKDRLSKKSLPPPTTKSSYSLRMNQEEFLFASVIIADWNSHGRRLIQFPKTLPANGWVRLKTKTAWASVNKVLSHVDRSQDDFSVSMGRFALARDNPGVGPRNKTHMQRLSLGNFILCDYFSDTPADLFLRSQFKFWLENEPKEGFKPSSLLKPWYHALKDQYVKRFGEADGLSENDLVSIHTGAMRLMKLSDEWDDNVAILPHLEIPGIQLYAQFMCDAIEWGRKRKIFRHVTPGVFKAKRLASICEEYFQSIGKWIG